jgi:hypothetical protein
VATSADLPIGSDVQGAIRVVLADNSIWVYDGTSAWTQAGGGSVPLGALDNTTIYLNGSAKVAIKPLGISDGLVANASSIIRAWSATIPYVIGQMAISSNGIWLCRVAGTNLAPSLATNNWRQLTNTDSAQNLVFAPTITALTYAFPISQTAAVIDSTAGDVTVTMPTIAAISNSDTPGRIQMFRLVKKAQINSMIINLGGGDTFLDGTTSLTVIAQGVTTVYAIFQTTTWCRG